MITVDHNTQHLIYRIPNGNTQFTKQPNTKLRSLAVAKIELVSFLTFSRKIAMANLHVSSLHILFI